MFEILNISNISMEIIQGVVHTVKKWLLKNLGILGILLWKKRHAL